MPSGTLPYQCNIFNSNPYLGRSDLASFTGVGADSSLPLIQTRARTSDINRRSLICVIGIILQFRLLQVGVKPHLRLAVARHGHTSIQTPTSVGVKSLTLLSRTPLPKSFNSNSRRSETRYGLTCPVMFSILQFELLLRQE